MVSHGAGGREAQPWAVRGQEVRECPSVGGPEGRVGVEDVRTLGTPTVPSPLSLPCGQEPHLPSKARLAWPVPSLL